jgi:hypothetical protein
LLEPGTELPAQANAVRVVSPRTSKRESRSRAGRKPALPGARRTKTSAEGTSREAPKRAKRSPGAEP